MKHIFIKNNDELYIEDIIRIIVEKISIVLEDEEIHPTNTINIINILRELESNMKDNLTLKKPPEYFDYVIFKEMIEDE